jgi:hypothetical protein
LEDVGAGLRFDFPGGVDEASGERYDVSGGEVEGLENGVEVHAAKIV